MKLQSSWYFHFFKFLLFVIILLPSFAFGQQEGDVTLQLKSNTNFLPSSVKVSQSYIEPLEAKADSIGLKAAIDSLHKLSLVPAKLAQKIDSLQNAFDSHLVSPISSLTISNLPSEINQVKEKLAKGIVPPPVQQTIENFNSEGLIFETPVGQLPTEITQSANYKDLVNTNAVADKAKQEALKAAENYFSTHQKELNQARAQLGKYKGRLEEVKSIKDLPKGFLKLNPLKDKPWQDRVILGSQFQFSRQEQYIIDGGPSLAWQFTDKISVGAGFQYRLSVSTKNKPWINTANKVYGFSAFSNLQIKKGFFVRVQYETLNTLVPNPNPVNEPSTKQWVPGLGIGAGKTYTFYKKINGYALMQYNLLHKRGETPYLQFLQARIGFYILGIKK